VRGGIKMDCDLIVVGAGPGGLMTAYEAARAGLEVVVIEKKKKTGAQTLLLFSSILG
jgi:flavin-dependent dehydrogenase